MQVHAFHTVRRRTIFASACLACMLSACGGGDSPAVSGPATAAATVPTPAPTPSATTVATAPLVVSAATPTSLNGTLDKSTAAFEHGSSNALMTTYATADDHCRVAAYTLHSSNGTAYYLEVSFRKDTKAIGRVNFGLDTGLVLLARAVAPVAGVTVDVASRRIGFTNVVVGNPPGTATSVTLNGSLEYPTNFTPESRAACG